MTLLLLQNALPEIDPSTIAMLKIAVGVYILFLLAISIYSARRIKDEADYLVAGRHLPLFLAWGTLMATWFGAATLFAAANSAREEGFLGVVLDPFACAFTLIFAGIFFARPLWKMKLLTMGDFYRTIYGPKAEFVAAMIQVPAYFGWIALQYTALAQIQHSYFGIDPTLGMLLAALVTLIYTMVGGMWSVTLTDTLQILVALFGLVLLGLAVFSDPALGDGNALRGVGVMFEKLGDTHPDHLRLVPAAGGIVIMGWLGSWITGLFGNIPGQDLQQRVFASRSAKIAVQACILAGVLYILFGLIPVGLGMASVVTHPDLDVDPVTFLAAHYLQPLPLVIFIIAVISMVVSTATSAVLAPAALLGHNLLSRLSAFRGAGVERDRICVLIVSLGGIVLAMQGQGMMELLDLALSIQLVALFIPVAMGIYGKPRGELSAILAITMGFGTWVVKYALELMEVTSDVGAVQALLDVPSDFYGFGFSVTGYFLGQAILGKRAKAAVAGA